MAKAKKSNRKRLEKELDNAWSTYVRNRDKKCCKCGSFGPVSAHHAFGRRHRATRWDVINGVGLDFYCHIQWAHRDPAGFTEWFRGHIGEDQYNRLTKAHNMIVKHTVEELEQMLENIRGLS